MITLYRTPDCPACRRMQEVLEDLVVDHRVVTVRRPADRPDDLPALRDDDQLIHGRDAVLAHLEELERFRELWYKFQSDACYCDEEGDVP